MQDQNINRFSDWQEPMSYISIFSHCPYMVEGARELSVASEPPGRPQIIDNSLTVIIVA